MTWHAAIPLLVVASSLVPGLIIFFLPERQRPLRTFLNLAGAVSKLVFVGIMLWGVSQQQHFETRVPLLPEFELVLRAGPLALLFVSLSAALWLVTTVYAIGFLEGSPHRSRFFGFFGLCVTATVGVALAGNLLTFILFYEMLTLSTYPLVIHKGTEKARKAGQTYLVYTLSGGAALLLGSIWLHQLTGTLEFTPRGFVETLPDQHHGELVIIFFLLVAGLGVKAAIVPLHSWLPKAMVAPAPVSALLHAVAVVKAGAFGIVRVVYEVFGVQFTSTLGVATPLAGLAAFTIIYGSLLAIFQEDLKRRLAYSTVSQISYIVLGIAIAGPIASIGGLVHLVHQGIMKITLFFSAGIFAKTLGIHKVSEMNGLGRRMPWTMAAFTLCALGMIGVPPIAGFISKWYLGAGALSEGEDWMAYVLSVSSLLNAAYFLPILNRAWFREPPAQWPEEHDFGARETAWTLLLPTLFTAFTALAAGLLAWAPFSPLEWARFVVQQEFY